MNMEDKKKKKKGFACEHCDVISISRAHLDIHLRTHFGIKPFSCSICGKAFNRKGNCKRHEMGHSGERPYECGVCFARYTSKGSLMKHLQFHTGENLLSCNICGRKFTQNSHLKIHLRTHTGEKPFKCSSCDKCFSLEYDLKMHRTIHEGRVMSCNICGKIFHHLGSFRGHMLRHTQKKTFKCPTCGIEFQANCSLKVHMRIHTGEKPFKCNICNKAFNRRSRLKEHGLIHKKEKSYRDTEYEKTVSCETSVDDSNQQYCNDESLFCVVCHKRYANKYSLNQHMKVHADEPIRCSDCQRVFTSSSYLKRHQENRACHIKKYRCPLCDRVFIKKVNIIIHVKNTHASEGGEGEPAAVGIEKPYQCSICKQCFSSKRSHIWHEICVHKSIDQIESDDVVQREPVKSDRPTISNDDACHDEMAVDGQNSCNFVEVSCHQSDEENTRDSSRERCEDVWNLYPENSIFIKEETSDEDTSNNTLGEDTAESSEHGDIRNVEDEMKGEDIILKDESHDDCVMIKDEEYY